MSTFQIGDIAILCNLPPYRGADRFNGHEVEIVAGLEFRHWTFDGDEPKEGACYLAKVPWSRLPWHVRPEFLRRKEPPKLSREDVGAWDLCPWQPAKAHAQGKEGQRG